MSFIKALVGYSKDNIITKFNALQVNLINKEMFFEKRIQELSSGLTQP